MNFWQVLLVAAIAMLVAPLSVLLAVWFIGFITSFTETCVCGSFLKRGRCTHPINHQPVADWAQPTTVAVAYRKPEPLALPRGDR